MSWNPADDSFVTDLSFRHLRAELARIDILIHRQVSRWQRAGQDDGDVYRGIYISDEEVQGLLNRPLASNWGENAGYSLEEDVKYLQELETANQQIQALVEDAHSQGKELRLEKLSTSCNLDQFDLDVFLICAASCLDLRYERIYGYLQDDVSRKQPGVNLVLDLLCDPGPDRLALLAHFDLDTPLFRYHILEKNDDQANPRQPLLSQTLAVDESIVAWLLGQYQPQAVLRSFVTLSNFQSGVESQAGLDLILPDVFLSNLQAMITGESMGVFYGSDLAGQQTAAHLLSMKTGRPLLALDLRALSREETSESSRLQAIRIVLRDAKLLGAIPLIEDWDACLVDGVAPPEMLVELCSYPGLLILSGRREWLVQGIRRERRLDWIEFPVPDYSERLALWRYFLDGSEGLEVLRIEQLAGQFSLTRGQIRDAVATAKDRAAQRGEPLHFTDLLAAACAHSSTRLSDLARKIRPRFTWKDIILPSDQLSILHEITNTVRGRHKVLMEWGVGQKLSSGTGVSILFAGPPGTGKTMAAEIIAGDLGLDLYKIDLSTVVSKYIGETEKNLSEIFQEAETSNAILFFDEADALFGKRSEVRDSHDRYANIEISYLLQRMEAYEGITILATNLRSNLDEAFTRRLQFAVDFPFPEEEDRLRIWETLFPAEVPREADIDLPLLARRFKLAGGSIRNIIVGAAYLAASDSGKVNMSHLLHSTRRELQKMGRLVGDQEMRLDHK